ncbi:Cilia- and flagella-associated protein 97 [Anthophora retusa]
MSGLQNIQSNCGCQYTLTLTNEIVQERFSETKDSFNHVPSIHEVDEEETDEEQTVDQESEAPNEIEQTTDLTKDIVDEDSSYSNDSFCSDVDSCNESEESKDTSRSLDDSHFSHSATTRKSNDPEQENCENAAACINETANSVRGKSAMSEDSYTDIKQMKNRRRNMSFTDEELRKIEWENQILLRKIMAQQRPKEKLLHDNVPPPRVSSSAINRKKLQKRIENENIMLLQRIQQTKSRVMNTTTKPGYRQTIL